MKWGNMQPQRTEWHWEEADKLVDFCEQHGLRLKGHTLVWHNQMPSWVTEGLTAQELRAEVLEHVTATVARYKGRIPAWDVVNEVRARAASTACAPPREWTHLDV